MIFVLIPTWYVLEYFINGQVYVVEYIHIIIEENLEKIAESKQNIKITLNEIFYTL